VVPRVDYGEFGETAAALLLAEIEGAPAPRFEPAEPELVVRDSSAPAQAERGVDAPGEGAQRSSTWPRGASSGLPGERDRGGAVTA